MKNELEIRDIDRKIWEEELDAFVPEEVYDVHAHLWNEAHAGNNADEGSMLRESVSYQELLRSSKRLFPNRKLSFFCLGTPLKGIDRAQHNSWLAKEAEQEESTRAFVIVTPDMSQDELRKAVDPESVIGLKPYRVYAEDMTNARIKDYLPERLMEIANEKGLAVMLHMAKVEGPASKENLDDLTEYSRRFPQIRWILAHCARSFNGVFLADSICVLKDIPNLYYDTSAVNDLYSFLLLFKHEKTSRIMFGTDNIAAGCMRGKYITYGYAWEGYKGNPDLEHCNPEPTFVCYEALRCMKQAAEILSLNHAQIRDIFYNNAVRFLKELGAS